MPLLESIPHIDKHTNSLLHTKPLLSTTLTLSQLFFQLSKCKNMISSQSSLHLHITSFSFNNTKSIIKCSFHNKKDFYYQPFSVLGQKIKSLTAFQYQNHSNCMNSIERSDFLHKNGTFFAIAVCNAKVKISPIVATLGANPTFVSGFFAWFIAQSVKVFLNFWLEKKWDLRVMCASGGMPSSHSALCTALTTSVAICHGVADSLFPVCLGFSLIVMYDAIGVRRHAGMQAEVLNVIIADLFQGHPISQRKLKELLGHTPSQVLAGALLGIVVAWFCCQGYSMTHLV